MGKVMQIIYFLFIAIAVTSYSSAVGKHHKREHKKSKLILEYDWPEPSKNLKRVPHPDSCFHFYLVKPDGSLAIKGCHGSEIFDYRSLRCKEKSSAKCWKDIVKKGHLKKMGRHFSCPFPWGLYPDTEDCSQFYDCLGGKPYLRKCPASTLFDKADRTCVRISEVMCADKSDVVDPGYKCPYQWGFYTHPKDCSKYYECLRKVPSVRTCKKNMLFDNFERKCLPMNMVKCDARFNPYEINRSSGEPVSIESISEKIGDLSFEVTQPTSNHISQRNTETKTTEITSVKTQVTPNKVVQETKPNRFDKVEEQINQVQTPDKNEQENTSTSHNKIAQQIIQTEPDKFTQKKTPYSASKLAQDSIDTVSKSDKDEHKTTPTSLDRITQENKVKLERVESENLKKIDLQEDTTVKTEEVSQKFAVIIPNKIEQETASMKSDKVTQNIKAEVNKDAPENTLKKSVINEQDKPVTVDEKFHQKITTSTGKIVQDNTPINFDKFMGKSPPGN